MANLYEFHSFSHWVCWVDNQREPWYCGNSPDYGMHFVYIYTEREREKERERERKRERERERNSVEDWQTRIVWQTINKLSRRKSTAKAKMKATNQERIKLWKQHFENLLGNPPKVTYEPITEIISKQLDIKLGSLTLEELDSVLRKIKNRKATRLDEIPQKYGRPDNSTTYCSDTVTQFIIKIR